MCEAFGHNFVGEKIECEISLPNNNKLLNELIEDWCKSSNWIWCCEESQAVLTHSHCTVESALNCQNLLAHTNSIRINCS